MPTQCNIVVCYFFRIMRLQMGILTVHIPSEISVEPNFDRPYGHKRTPSLFQRVIFHFSISQIMTNYSILWFISSHVLGEVTCKNRINLLS